MASALAALTVALLGVLCATHALEVGRCVSPLGMESKAIPDSAISASSAYDSSIVGPQHGRLRIDKNGGAWCPRHMVTRDSLEWLEVDLRHLHVISAVQTQGRFGNGQGQEYAEVYMIDYWRPGSTKWIRWRSRSGDEMLEGNVNTFTVVERRLDPPLISSKIRFVPYSFHMRTVCMRIELLGCSWQEGIVTYSMPQGASRGAEVDLSDRTYDGREDGGHLTGGLGQLTDGQRGQDNFRMDLNGNGKGYEWVGWRNDSSGMGGRPVEIVFEFDRVRNFSAMYIHTNNLFSKDVQVFSQAKVYFSKGGHQFLGEPVYFTYMPDLIMEFARNVTIKLHNRIGRFIRLQLYFAQKWIMISEVSFDAVIVSGNITDEEVDATLVKTSSTSATGKEDTLQRDAAPGLTKGHDDRHQLSSNSRESGSGGGSGSGSSGLATASDRSASDSATSAAAAAYVTRSFAGLIIGVLTAVILLLTAAIFFIVLRIRRRGPNHIIVGGDNLPSNGIIGTGMPLTLSTSEKPVSANLKVSLDSEAVSLDSMAKPPPPVVSTPSAVYHEPYPPGTISGGYLHPGQSHLQTLSSPDYTDVPEMLPQEYAIPQGISGTPPPPFCSPPPNNGAVTTPGSARPSIQLLYPASTISATTTNINLISNPPPVPPPPEKYYAATEICAPPLPPPPAAPLVLPLLADLAARSTSEEDSDDFEDDTLKAVNLPTFPRERLRILKLLGYGKFGEVHLCSVEGTPGTPVDSENSIVSVKTLDVGAGEQTRSAFERSARVAGLLRDANLAGVLGACLSDEPRCIVFEYGCWGDLNQFLQNRVAESAAVAAAATLPCSARTLSYGCLIYMATQIASGMKYLESINYIHKDLATRNCLVGREYSIKVSDLGIGASLYPPDYYKLDSRPSLPIRWMAWESILLGKMSSKSDVWSFAVTLWEILTFAREQPFDELADEGVVENASRFFQDLPIRILLPCPINCPKEIYDLMCECWQRNESDRPHFREIHLFLQRKNLGYVPSMD